MIPSIFGGKSAGSLDPVLDLNFLECDYGVDSRLVCSGGANGSRVNSTATIVPAVAPRIDFNPDTAVVRGLLVEEARTNDWSRSAEVGITTWTTTNAAATANATAAPDGTNTATLIVPSSGLSGGRANRAFAFVAGTTYASEIFVKPAGKTTWQILAPLSLFTDATARTGTFTLTGAGASAVSGGGAVAFIEKRTDGYYRCVLVWTPTVSGSTSVQFRDSGVGDGVNGVYLWGGESKTESAPTSYIPSVAAAVTRTGDRITMAQSAIEGTWLIDFTTGPGLINGACYWGVAASGDANNAVYLWNGGGNLDLSVNLGGVMQTVALGALAPLTTYKAAVSVDPTNALFAARVNGGAEKTINSNLPACAVMSVLSAPWGNFNHACAWARRIRRWDRSRRGELLALSA